MAGAMTPKINQKGQSTIEAAVMASLLVMFSVVFVAAMYLVYASYWTEHIMYESLVCYQERGNKSICLKEAQEKIKSVMLFKEAFSLKMETSPTVSTSTIKLDLDLPVLGQKTLHFKKELRF